MLHVYAHQIAEIMSLALATVSQMRQLGRQGLVILVKGADR